MRITPLYRLGALALALALTLLDVNAVLAYGPEAKVVNGYVEPTEIKRNGDYLVIDTKFHIPTKLFKTDYRYIAQPVLVDHDKGQATPLRPIVINGEKYPQIQNRWLRFGKVEDELSQYVVDKEITSGDNICVYRDSILIDRDDAQLKHTYEAKCVMALVTYHEPPIFIDSMVFAHGVVNPAQHLSYDFEPMQLDNTLLEPECEPYLLPTGIDTVYIPEYEMRMQHRGGVAKIAFNVNSSTINYSDRNTWLTISKIRSFLESLQNNEDATIRSISLFGNSSPEGQYKKNVDLAQRRTEEVQRIISAKLKPTTLESAEINVSSQVEPWSSLADLMREKHPVTAEKIDVIFEQCNKDFDATNARVVRLAEYRKTIVPYLNELRRVNYSIDYTIYKPLPYEVIRKMYDKRESLTAYEYYVLISNESDQSLIAQMERDAVEAIPDFVIFANRAAIDSIRNGRWNLGVLEPLIKQDSTPMPVVYNQAIMSLKSDSVNMFYSLVDRISTRPQAREMVGAKYAMHDDFDQAYPYFEGSNTITEVVLLLEREQNDEAKAIMDDLMADSKNTDRANYCYVSAICNKRCDAVDQAKQMLERAISLDPQYTQIAERDGDMWSIYQLMNNKKTE